MSGEGSGLGETNARIPLESHLKRQASIQPQS